MELIAALGDGPRLLLLDNVEHPLPAASLVAKLLATRPALRVLATSRGGGGSRGRRSPLTRRPCFRSAITASPIRSRRGPRRAGTATTSPRGATVASPPPTVATLAAPGSAGRSSGFAPKSRPTSAPPRTRRERR